jgi:uncharacterized membrane protein YbhN (UPF0104 family)
MKPRHPWLRRAARIGFFVFLAVVAWLLVRAARSIDWHQVGAAIRSYDTTTLLLAAGVTLASYGLYTCYDLGARRYAHHALSIPRTLGIAFVSYAFALNIGALVGGAGFRYRLYSHSGLGVATISRIVAFSVSTNWIGYTALAGVLFLLQPPTPPPGWEIGATGLRALGVVLLLALAAYFVACHLTHGRVFHVRGHHFRLPSPPMAMLQVALAATNWALMAAILHLLLPDALSYPQVLGVLLLASVATAMAHIPAGIGVLEAVFIALLGHLLPPPQLLAGLLAYRAFYYLAPLLLAVVVYLLLESRGRRSAATV